MIPFGDIPEEFRNLEEAPIVILPIPYDGTSTWQKGADRGPEALLLASANMELYDIETDSEPYKTGIYTAPPILVDSCPEEMTEAVFNASLGYLKLGKFLIGIGGEHSVSFGMIKAYAEKYPNLTVLQLDAHTDLREEYEGSAYNHACVMARAQDLCPVIQVGIRSMDTVEKDRLIPSKVFWAHEMQKDKEWMYKAIEQLGPDVFITIDLDVFDPSIMPSTGTPEPGGLFWYDTLEFMRKVIKSRNVVGFDVVELCPNDINKSPDFLAAKLVYKLINYRFNKTVSFIH